MNHAAVGWMDFTASLVRSLAWPVAVVIAVFVLRRRIAEMLAALAARLGDLKKLSAMGVDLEFEREAAQVSAAAEELAPDGVGNAIASDPELDRLKRLAEIEPRAAILLGFIDVEAALRSTADRSVKDLRLHERWRRGASIGSIARELNRRDIISEQAVGVLSELAGLRNQVSHDSEVRLSTAAAQSYVDAALEMIRYLNEIREAPSP
jgi:hypothetical protein